MSSFAQPTRGQTRREIPKAATEPQTVITWGEAFLDRARQVGHKIEDEVRRLLDESTNAASNALPMRPDHLLSNCDAENEQADAEMTVDNRRRCG